MSPKPNEAIASPNFAFLAKHDALLVRFGAQAERYVFEDPNTALIKLRQFSEVLAKLAAAQVGLYIVSEEGFVDVLSRLNDSGVLTPDVAQLFHALRRAGNAAAHDQHGTQGEALNQLRMARTLGIWFHRAFGDKNFKPGPFVPPPDPAKASKELAAELERLRKEAAEHQAAASSAQQTAAQEAKARAQAEAAAELAYKELAVALELAGESELKATAEKKRLEEELAAQQAIATAAPAVELQAKIKSAGAAGEKLELDEAATRRLIDAQLIEVGWEADSETLRYGKGVRPQKGRNMAIAEWPTTNGPADYVLFFGLTPLAVVEPDDYLKSFREFITINLNLIPALLVVAQRPRDLTRTQLRELMLELDLAGYSETALRTAWRETTNQDIAATIIGHIRHAVDGSPLVPYKERVAKAMQKILASRAWTAPQRKWLERIGKQLEVETIVDREALDRGEFQAQGGFARLNKIFDGKLQELLQDMTETIWKSAA